MLIISEELRDRVLDALGIYATTACGGGQEDLSELREALRRLETMEGNNG